MTDVIILNWETINVSADSIRILKKEPDVNIIVVDSGSLDTDKEVLRSIEGITYIDLPENKGASVARNIGLAVSTAKYILLLDGDILYLKDSINNLRTYIGMLENAGCVGIHNSERFDGTRNREEADIKWMGNYGSPRDDFPMAWTQYGLFRGEMLRALKFYEEGVFGEAGNGYEDDWLYRHMLEGGYKSYYVDKVLYYHEAHAGNRNLKALGIDNKNKERKELFNAIWGKAWHEK